MSYLDLTIQFIVTRVVALLSRKHQHWSFPTIVMRTLVAVRDRLYMPSLIVRLRCGAPRWVCAMELETAAARTTRSMGGHPSAVSKYILEGLARAALIVLYT